MGLVTSILTGLLIVVIILSAIIIRNLLLQTEQLEDHILKSREKASETLTLMRKLDDKKMFEKDDEVGNAFARIVNLVEYLNTQI